MESIQAIQSMHSLQDSYSADLKCCWT